MDMTAPFLSGPSRLMLVLVAVVGIGSGGCARSPATNPGIALGDAFARAAEEVRPSVVYLEALRAPSGPGENGGPATGSGFVVRPGGIVLTNNHVVDGAQAVSARLFDGRVVPVKILGKDPGTDLAVLQLPVQDLKPVRFGDAARVRVGDLVLAIGNPLGGDLNFTVTAGIVSALGRRLDLPGQSPFSIQDYIQVDAALNPGSSGGPVVNADGAVIGVAGAIESGTGFSVGYGFAIPVDLAQAVIEQLVRFGRIRRMAVGAIIEEATVGDARWAGLSQKTGMTVQQVFPGSPAENAKLVPGDILLSVNGVAIASLGAFQTQLAFRTPGDTVALVVARAAGRRDSVRLPLIAIESGDTAAPAPSPKLPSDVVDQRLGLAVEQAPAALLRQWSLEAREVLLVTGVRPGGPAWGVVLGPGRETSTSLLIRVNDTAVPTVAALRGVLGSVRGGEAITLELLNPTGPRLKRIVAGE